MHVLLNALILESLLPYSDLFLTYSCRVFTFRQLVTVDHGLIESVKCAFPSFISSQVCLSFNKNFNLHPYLENNSNSNL